MSDGQRIFAIVMGCLGIFLLVMIGMGAVWWSQQGALWFAQGKASFEEGRTIGSTEDNHRCLEHSLERYGSCDGMGCEISVLVFLNACLSEASQSPDFCHDVPVQTAFIQSIRWRKERCEAAGYPRDSCEQLFASVQGYCDGLRLNGAPGFDESSPSGQSGDA